MAKRIFVSITCFASLFLVVGFATHGDSSDSGFNPPKGFFLYKSAPKESSGGRGVAIQPDGKIVVVGDSHYAKSRDILVLRCNSDGSVDSTFGKGGVTTYKSRAKENQDIGFGVALQPDGKIVMVGVSNTAKKCDVLTVRYNADGSLDKAFGEDGVAPSSCPPGGHDWGRSIAIQPDGKIIVA